jgi:hypothetical protein
MKQRKEGIDGQIRTTGISGVLPRFVGLYGASGGQVGLAAAIINAKVAVKQFREKTNDISS